jgi:hypothetical protein
MIEFAERRIQPPVMIDDRARAIDIERRPMRAGDLLKVDVFAMQSAVAVMEGVQGANVRSPDASANDQR